MIVNNASDLRKYIQDNFRMLPADKVEVLKCYTTYVLIIITKDCKIAKRAIFKGDIKTVNNILPLKNKLDNEIIKFLSKHGYC